MELNEKTLKKLNSELKKLFTGNKKLKENRPILNSLHYTEDGHVEFTNSHVAVRIKNVHEEPEHTVPEDLGEYPNLGRLFDGAETGAIRFQLDTKLMSDMLSPFKIAKCEYVKLTITGEGITFIPDNSESIVEAHLQIPVDIDEPFQIAFNVKYLYNAMMFFKTQKMFTVDVIASSQVRPLLLVHDNVQYLLTPVRVGWE